MIQLISLRYMKPYNVCVTTGIKNFGMWLHVASGIIILIITVTMSLLAFQFYAWKLRFNESIHSAIGFVILIAIFVITVFGFLAWATLAYGKGTDPSPFWKFTNQAAFIHRWLSYLTLALAQATIFLGVLRYNARTLDHTLGTANIVVFFVVWAFLELIHQFKLRRKVTLLENSKWGGSSARVISIQELKWKIAVRREKLAIMEDVVVDVSRYMDGHPGGK